MILLLILIGFLVLLVSYYIYAVRAFDILERIGSEGSFMEWFFVICPILNMVFSLKNRKISNFTTIWEFINPRHFNEEYSTINKNLETFKERENNRKKILCSRKETMN